MTRAALLASVPWHTLPANPPPHPFNAVAEALGFELALMRMDAGGIYTSRANIVRLMEHPEITARRLAMATPSSADLTRSLG